MYRPCTIARSLSVINTQLTYSTVYHTIDMAVHPSNLYDPIPFPVFAIQYDNIQHTIPHHSGVNVQLCQTHAPI